MSHRFLLDTQVFLWAMQDEKLVPSRVRTILAKEDHAFFLSLASLWEMQIKLSLHKLKLSHSIADIVQLGITHMGIELLPIQTNHIYRLGKFPFHHRDPFDRLIIAQAVEENVTVISSDSQWDAYGIKRIW